MDIDVLKILKSEIYIFRALNISVIHKQCVWYYDQIFPP